VRWFDWWIRPETLNLIPEQAHGAWMRVKTPEKGEEGDDSRVVNFFLRNK
jgi:hypothetical protein